jgi:hypothetical protein
MIECTICPILWNNIKKYLTDTTKIFSKDFVKQNYHKHLGYSLVLTFFSMWLLLSYAHLAETGMPFQLFIGGFGAYAVNFVREWYYGIKYGAPWDFTDLNMGSYGGIIGALLAVLFTI